MKTFRNVLLLAFLTIFMSCSTDNTAPLEDDVTADLKKKPQATGIIVTWRPGTTPLQRHNIRQQYDHLFSSWAYCEIDTEIWFDYCKGCQPFQDPLNDPSGRIENTQRKDDCPE